MRVFFLKWKIKDLLTTMGECLFERYSGWRLGDG